MLLVPEKLKASQQLLTPIILRDRNYQFLAVNEDGLKWLAATFGITPLFLRDMQELGFSLAGGAAAALVHVLAHGQAPDYTVGDADFFPNSMCPPDAGLALSPEERGRRLLGVLKEHEFYPSSHLVNWALSFQKTEVLSTAPFFGGNPWENAEPILTERKLSARCRPLQIMMNFLTQSDEAVWENFDFTAVAAVLYASETGVDLVIHERMPPAYNLRELRWLTKPVNPIRSFSRIQKYTAKGFTLPKPQLVQWMDWLDEPITNAHGNVVGTWREALRGNLDPETVPYHNIPAPFLRPALNEDELLPPVRELYQQCHEVARTLNLS